VFHPDYAATQRFKSLSDGSELLESGFKVFCDFQGDYSPAPPSNSTLSGNTTAARPCCLRIVKCAGGN
jgi:hypothetical protein